MAKTKPQIATEMETLLPEVEQAYVVYAQKLQKLKELLAEAKSCNATQLMQLNLQDKIQKLNQFIQTLANIRQNMYDTAKAIINNLKG